MENVKNHFEIEAEQFDGIIRKLIPYYEQILDALVASLPFNRSQPLRVIDLGCGTGTIAKRIKEAFPLAQITCVDIAENMLRMARGKLGDGPEMRYQVANFENYSFDSTYDAAVSSLALHHLLTDADKIEFYKKIFTALSAGGVFLNADVVLDSTRHLQGLAMDKWRRYMRQSVSEEEIEQKWIPTHFAEDHPAHLIGQLEWLRNIGFVHVDVVWKYFNFAVYGGRKE